MNCVCTPCYETGPGNSPAALDLLEISERLLLLTAITGTSEDNDDFSGGLESKEEGRVSSDQGRPFSPPASPEVTIQQGGDVVFVKDHSPSHKNGHNSNSTKCEFEPK